MLFVASDLPEVQVLREQRGQRSPGSVGELPQTINVLLALADRDYVAALTAARAGKTVPRPHSRWSEA